MVLQQLLFKQVLLEHILLYFPMLETTLLLLHNSPRLLQLQRGSLKTEDNELI